MGPTSGGAERMSERMTDMRLPRLDWRVAGLLLVLTSCIFRAALSDTVCTGTPSAETGGSSDLSKEASACWNELSARSQARIEEFFELVNAHRVDDAIAILGGSLLETEDDRQAWRQQLSAITAIRIQFILPAVVEDWTATRQIFKLALEVTVSADAANQPIPYYGWNSNPNIRWVTTELSAQGQWQITAIGSGP
jgi:hypothetical protein